MVKKITKVAARASTKIKKTETSKKIKKTAKGVISKLKKNKEDVATMSKMWPESKNLPEKDGKNEQGEGNTSLKVNTKNSDKKLSKTSKNGDEGENQQDKESPDIYEKKFQNKNKLISFETNITVSTTGQNEGEMIVEEKETSASSKKTGSKKQEKAAVPKKKQDSHYTLFVGNLPYQVSTGQVQDHFRQLVTCVKSVRLPTDRNTGKPRGIAFVEVTGEKDYQAALSLDKTFLSGRRINVEYTCAGSKKGKRRSAKIKSKNYKFEDLRRRGIMTASKGANKIHSKAKAKMEDA